MLATRYTAHTVILISKIRILGEVCIISSVIASSRIVAL